MLCDNCKKNEATLVVKQTFNGQKKEYNLCQDCVSMSYEEMSFDTMLQGFLNSFIDINEYNQEQKNQDLITCSVCGMSLDEIKRVGKIGCSKCYETYADELKNIVKNIQGTNNHVGKYIKSVAPEIKEKRRLSDLGHQLKENIKIENYEEAARIRDEIKAIKKEDINDEMV